MLTYMGVEEKALKGSCQFSVQQASTLCILPILAPREVCSWQFCQKLECDCVKVLLTPETPIEVRIGNVLRWVVCGMFFVLLLLVDNPVKAKGD